MKRNYLENTIQATRHMDRLGLHFVTFEWIGSKYRPAKINALWLDDKNYELLFNQAFDVEIIETFDFNRMALVVRKDVLFGILPPIYKTKLKIDFFLMKRKAKFILRMQAYGLAYTREGSYHSWRDLGKKPSEYDKKMAKDVVKMWKERGK